MRIGVIKDWDARWYADKNYVELLHEDLKVRKFVKAKLFESGVADIITERTGNTKLRVTIHTAKPGIVIGAKGAEIEKLRKELEGSNAVSMQNYRMDKQIRTLAEKNRLHDELHRQTARQIDLLNGWLKELLDTSDRQTKRELLRRIVVVGAYLKRRNNLILVNEQDGMIKEEELKLSLQEMVKNLQLAGVTSACAVEFEKELPTDAAMQLFDFYEFVVEHAFDGLQSLLARFFCRDGCYYACVDAVCSLDLTGLQTERISVSKSDENCYTLSLALKGGAM